MKVIVRTAQCAMAVISLGFAAALSAAVPASGTISETNPTLTYEAGPFPVRNPTAGAILVEAECQEPALPCDFFELTVNLSPAYAAAHPDDVIAIEWKWPNPVEDYDYQVLDAEGNVVISAGTASDPENATIGAKNGVYRLKGLPFLVAGGSFTGTLKLLSPTLAPIPPQPTDRAPEYVSLQPPNGLGGGAGEPSIGFNPGTGRIMYLAGTTTLRATFPENLPEPQPEVCDPLWEDVSFAYTSVITADPILFTDQGTGRTFVSQMHIPVPVPPTAVGLNSIFAYTDDDGDTWVPGQIGPPEGGYDHQTVGAGPFPASLSALSNPSNGGSAVYYCSQAGTSAFCARSDTGGLTFPTGFPIYDVVDDGFGGIHGHVKVGPDGAVYVPVKACGTQQCYTTSTDGGVTWETVYIPNTTPGPTDPSIAISPKDPNSLYFCYVDGDGHPKVQVSSDKGATWKNKYDIGAVGQIVNSVFPSAVAGDADRAACVFLGTTQGGNFQALDFPGLWYGFSATTTDSGTTWHTVNTTPNAPVQRETGVWLGGGGAQQRNLLDFNGVTRDAHGNVLFGFADGCTGDCETGAASNTFDDYASVSRQVGGKPLFAEFDPPIPDKPKAACLAGTRDVTAAHLNWRVPYSGGSEITGYKIYRGQPVGNEVLIGESTGAKARYDDFSHDVNVAEYSYKIVAVNAQGDSVFSNLIQLPLSLVSEESSCTLPGITLYTDPAGDDTAGVEGQDLSYTSLAEPKDQDGKLVLTMKVASLSPAPPPNTRWVTYFTTPDGVDRYAAMLSDQGLPRYEYGTSSLDPAAGTARVFSQEGTPEGTYGADGTIVITLDKAAIGALKTGDLLEGITTSIRSTSPGTGAGTSLDTANTTEYILRGTAVCDAKAVVPPPVVSSAPSKDEGRFGAGGLSLGLLSLFGFAALRRRRV